MNQRPRQGDTRRQRTRSAIATAASNLFFSQGVQRTTVDEIAYEASVSVGSIYVHFGNKESLYLTLVEEALDTAERYVLGRKWSSSPLERLLNIGEAYVDFAIEETAVYRLIAMRARGASTSPLTTAIDERISKRMHRIVGLVMADAVAAAEAGEIQSMPPENVIVYLIGSWNGVIGLHLREGEMQVPGEVVRTTLRMAADVLVRGLGGTPPSELRAQRATDAHQA